MFSALSLLKRLIQLSAAIQFLWVGVALAQTSQLANISTRSQVLTGNDVMIAGFVIQGNQQTVVVRARGPSLAQFGITNPLANPRIDVYSGQTLIASNDNWQSALNASAIQASGFAPSNSLEAAVYLTLNPGAYTAIVSGSGGSTGVAIVEVFAANVAQGLSAKLLGGTWTFVYTIISTFTDNYTLTTIDALPGPSGAYGVLGVDTFGGTVAAAYFPNTNNWSLLDPGSIIDKFYVFTFSTINNVTGCYYQINPPGSNNLSPCYAMMGSRSPLLPAALRQEGTPIKTPEELLIAEGVQRSQGFIQPEAIQLYQETRKLLLK